MSTIFQDYALFPHLNVHGNIEYGLKLKRVPREEINSKYVEKLELMKQKWTAKAKAKMHALDLLQEKYETELESLKPGTFQYRRRQNWLDDSDFKYSYWENYVNQKVEAFRNAHFMRKMTKDEREAKINKIIELVGLKGNETKTFPNYLEEWNSVLH
ncbi:hypothetical protein [Mycoplasma nasistruthionis]|uniref:hypothetical protein n=1 Tax=Mycoplasma nasistruthionis TaxID=353852 RepID=UPI0030B81626